MTRRSVALVGILGTCVTALPVGAEPSPNAGWARTSTAERIAGRRALATARSAGGGDETRVSAPQIPLRGSERPELFFRWELFQRLLDSGFADDVWARAAFRDAAGERARLAGLPPPDWNTIEMIAAPLLESLAAQRRAARFLTRDDPAAFAAQLAELEQLQADDCALRAEALRGLVRELGGEHADRLLYEVVAPTAFLVTTVEADTVERHRFIEGGCR